MENVAGRALSRIAWIFRVSEEELGPEKRFGSDLRESFVSDFRHNELDRIGFDIEEMVDGIGDISIRSRKVQTVAEFCALAEEFRAAKPEGYDQLVADWEKEANMVHRPFWRRLIHRAIGL
jgi:hypothetical protein